MVKKSKQKVTLNMTRRKQPAAKAATKREVGLLGRALRGLGGLGGSALGGAFGMPLAGASAGNSLGAAISKWLGAGDYTVSQNSIVKSVRASDGIPMMHNDNQTVVVRHKEFIAEIKGSVGFEVQRFFLLQPGDTNTFPWLSKMATMYQQYRVRGMVFHYVPTSGYAVSGSNPAIGSVMMQTSYRANDSVPTTKVEMLNEYWASEASPADGFCHPIECSPKENPFSVHYVRSAPVPANDSPLLYDMGVTYVATSGMPANNVVGDLFVTYEIEFSKPMVLSSAVQEPMFITRFTPTTLNPFGAGLTSLRYGNGTLDFASRTITFPLGTTGDFIITMRLRAASITAFSSATDPTYVNCARLAIDSSGETFPGYTATGMSAAMQTMTFGVRVTGASTQSSLTLGDYAFTATGSTWLYLTIDRI